MLKKIKELLSYIFGAFIITNFIVIWLQGGKYNYHSHTNYRLGLIISIPLTIFVAIKAGFEIFKRKS